MIDINLIPDSLRKKNKKEILSQGFLNMPQEIVVGVGGGVIVLLLLVDFCFGMTWLAKFIQHKYYQSQWQAILPDKNHVDKISGELHDTQAKIKSLKDVIKGQGALWSQELNIISDSLPKAAWLKKISLDDKKLTIEGTTVSKVHNEMESVSTFVANLKQDENFMGHYKNLDINSIQRRKTNALDVADFNIVAQFK